MNTLTPHDTNDFCKRFDSFGDAVVVLLTHIFTNDSTYQTTIVISVQDKNLANEEWVDVWLYLKGVTEFKLPSMRTSWDILSWQVLSMGVAFVWMNGKLCCDFSMHYSENLTIDIMRDSDFFFVASSLEWEIDGKSIGQRGPW